MTAKELFANALGRATAIVAQVKPADFGQPTPDTEWTVKDLAKHMLYELAWVSDLVAGKTIAEIGGRYEGDLMGDDLVASWQHHAEAALETVAACDPAATAHLSYADVPVEEYLWEVGNDLLIHAWDLGEGIGVKVVFDEAAAQVLYDKAAPKQAELAGTGLYAAAVKVSDAASIQAKLLAVLGRSEHWAHKGR